MVMLGLTILLVGARLHGFSEPLERDITTYAVIGQEMLQGRQLYTDLWDHKPPAIYLSFAVARFLSPSPRAAVFLANSVASVAILLGVFVAGSAGRHGNLGGLFSAVVWVVISGNMWLEGNQPNTEVFLNACLVWAFAIALRAVGPGVSSFGLVTAGVLFAVATLYKQTTVLVAAALVGALAIAWWLDLDRESTANDPVQPTRRRWLQSVALVAAPGFVAWLVTFSYFAVRGRFDDLWSAVFVYNRSYAGDVAENMTAI
jgi:4-amino-4-deoxy-L-arabinose transferase-like glycosyltransferase